MFFGYFHDINYNCQNYQNILLLMKEYRAKTKYPFNYCKLLFSSENSGACPHSSIINWFNQKWAFHTRL